ncbi:MAG: GLPGLI family protein [Arachidicoccus sp.]|nr:GLPGLI family protein [Arachidicoccus sp.]
MKRYNTVYLFISTVMFGVIGYHKANAQALDSAYIECRYSFSYILDSTKTESKGSDVMSLLIGKNISNFFSYNQYRVDSLVNEDKKGVSETETSDNKNKYGKGGLSYHIFQNYPTGKISYFSKLITKDYKYEEDLNSYHWNILKDTSVILGYKVQKAACFYGGRNWIVWFAPDIAISSGPWKFNGLPGLVLSAEDDKNYFNFTIVGLNYLFPKKPIIFNIEGKEQYKNIKKEEYLKLAYKLNTNLFTFMKENLDITITRADGTLPKLRIYTPIELY